MVAALVVTSGDMPNMMMPCVKLLLLLLLLLQVVSPFTADGLLGDWEITQRLWEYALRWEPVG
jgi:hypothetical protein